MYTSFIQGIEEYIKKSRSASRFNPELFHHHGSTGITRANLLKEIVMRLLLCGYYQEIEVLLSQGKKDNNSYFNSSISTRFIRQIKNNTQFDSKYSSKDIAKILNSGNNNSSSMRTFLKKNMLLSDNRITTSERRLPHLYVKHIDHSIMAYKAFSATLKNPLDPFYRKQGSNKKQILKHLHMINDRDDKNKNIDFMEFDFFSNVDLTLDHLYMRDSKISAYHLPAYFKSNKIAFVSLIDDEFQINKNMLYPSGTVEIYLFTGITGVTSSHKEQKQKSVLGFISYNKQSKSMTISFRGSRSTSAVECMVNALLYSAGSADWLTDLDFVNHTWDPNDSTLGSTYKTVFTNINNIQISQGFTRAFSSAVKNIACIINFIKNEHKTIKSISTTGHSLGGALAQVCYLSLRFGFLNKQASISDASLSCFPFSAPPVLTMSSIKKLNLENHPNIIHSYIESDLIHSIDLNDKKKSQFVQFYVGGKELAHFGNNLFRFCPGVYKKYIGFPDSHRYENLYKLPPLERVLPVHNIKKLKEIENNKNLNYIECLFHIIRTLDFDIMRESIQFIGVKKKINVSRVLFQINSAQTAYNSIDPNNASTLVGYQVVLQHINNIILLMKKKEIKTYIRVLEIYREALQDCI